MKITALEEYGLRCLLRVAEQSDGEAISAQVIADREGLSLPYTQKILRILSMGGLINSQRGAQGGFTLARSADAISLGDAMRVLGGMIELEEICERHTGELQQCCNRERCSIRPVWRFVADFLVHTLDNLPLSVLASDEASVVRHLELVRAATTDEQIQA